MTAIYSLLSAAKTQEKNLETTSNNLANVNTVGFKSNKPVFQEFLKSTTGIGNPNLEENFIKDDQTAPVPGGNTRYAVAIETANNMTNGGFKSTENPLDFAIKGEGFFTIDTPFGQRYTKDGQFSRSATGFLTDSNGNYVVGSNGRIAINGSNINVTEQGLVSVDGLFIDQLQISNFENQSQLTKLGNNYYAPGPGQQQINNNNYSILQGFVEESNVSLVAEMNNLIISNRSFDAAQRGIKTMDDLDEQSLRLAR